MELVLDILAVLLGFVLLGKGADWLVTGGVGIASRHSISRTVIGLTIVSYGTSFPEFMVSTISSLTGCSGIALGNVLGSNIANVALILGTAMVIAPAFSSKELIRRDVPILLGATLAMLLFLWDGVVTRWEGMALAIAGALYTWMLVRSPGAHAPESEDIPDTESMTTGRAALLILLGSVALGAGAEGVVYGGKGLGHLIGLSDRVIGLTVVAVGTSLPELFASVVAAVRGESGISFGNVVGSNIFNILFVLGTASAIAPIGVPNSLGLTVDLAVVALFTIALVPLVWGGRKVSRLEGLLLLGGYLVYWGWLALSQGLISL